MNELCADYEVFGEAHHVRLERFREVWNKGHDAMSTCVIQIDRVWNHIRTQELTMHHNRHFVDYSLIPGMDPEWCSQNTNVQLPYDLYVNRHSIARDVVRLETLFEVILELLDNHIIPPETVWDKFLVWTVSFCTRSSLPDNAQPEPPQMEVDELDDLDNSSDLDF